MKYPRTPTQLEVQDLVAYLKAEGYTDDEDIGGLIAQACVAVFDRYISDGPGYAGRVMVVVWSGGPELHEVLTYTKDGNLVREKSEFPA